MTDRAKVFLETASADETLKAQLFATLKDLENAEQIPQVINFAENWVMS